MEIELTIEVFPEGKAYVSYTPELQIASCGKTPAEAERMLREAVALVLEDAREQGDLEALLANAGLERTEDGNIRRAPQRVFGRLRVAVPA